MTRLIPTTAIKNHDIRYIHLKIDMDEEERDNHMLHIVMPQHALKTGMKKFNKRGESAVIK